MQCILTVDPGCFTMGACLWDFNEWSIKKNITKPMPLLKTMCVDYTVKERNQLDPNTAMAHHMEKLKVWFKKYKIVTCYCEKPRLFPSARGFASSIKGHIQYLDMFRGLLFSLCIANKCTFEDVDVLEWKGQLPKGLVNERIKEISSKKDRMLLTVNASHDWDAFGIGLYVQGFFK